MLIRQIVRLPSDFWERDIDLQFDGDSEVRIAKKNKIPFLGL